MGGFLAFRSQRHPYSQVPAAAHTGRALSVSEAGWPQICRAWISWAGATSQVPGPLTPPMESSPGGSGCLTFKSSCHLSPLVRRWLSASTHRSSQLCEGRCSHPVLDEETGAQGGEATSPMGEATHWPVTRDGDTSAHIGRMSFPHEPRACISQTTPGRGGQSLLHLEPGE